MLSSYPLCPILVKCVHVLEPDTQIVSSSDQTNVHLRPVSTTPAHGNAMARSHVRFMSFCSYPIAWQWVHLNTPFRKVWMEPLDSSRRPTTVSPRLSTPCKSVDMDPLPETHEPSATRSSAVSSHQRVNGFERPFSRDQVISWIGHSVSGLSFFLGAAGVLLCTGHDHSHDEHDASDSITTLVGTTMGHAAKRAIDVTT